MKPFSSFDPNRDLQRALANLEVFSQQIENEPFTRLSRFEVKEGKIIAISETVLSKIISLAYHIVVPAVEGKSEEQKVLEEVLESSNVVRSYLPLFQMLEEGDSEQQKFVAHVKGAIARFNCVIDKVLAPPPTLTGRIVHFFYEESRQLMGMRLKKIDFPQKASLKIDFPQKLPSGTGEAYKISSKMNFEAATSRLQKIAIVHDAIMLGSPLSRQTLELYAMKVISLLGQHASLPHGEAQIIVDKTAKQATLDTQKQQLTISQQLEPMPGQQFDIAVSFRADPLTAKFTIPVLTYQMSTRVMQSGFPHPLQHNGWALADFLVVPSLQNPEEFPHLEALFTAKQLSAAKLLPHGEFAERARKLLRLKRAAFKEHKEEFLALFHVLTLAMAKAARLEDGLVDFQKKSSAFFTAAATSPYPYDFVADAHQLVLECAIYRPQKGLQKFWLENGFQGEGSIDLTTIKQVFHAEFQKSMDELLMQKNKSECAKEQCILEYCQELATLFFEPAAQIALQQHSQILKISMPTFDRFTQKLQAALYLQLWEFQLELNQDFTPTAMTDRLRRLLENDIALFEAEDFSGFGWEAIAVTKELNAYYQKIEQRRL